jgi:hypothetical protein
LYGWIWKHLPGPWPLKTVLALALLLAVVLVLFQWVFPWLEPRLPFNQVTVDEGSTTSVVVSLLR